MDEITIDIGADATPAVRVLDEGFAPLDLPRNATLNDDGGVTIALDTPVTLEFRAVGGGTVQTVDYHELTLRRLKGVDIARVLLAKNSIDVAIARATGLSPARTALLLERMDAADVTTVRETIAALLGGMEDGLPRHAQEIDRKVHLPLRDPVDDGDGLSLDKLTFRRLNGGDLKAIGEAKDTLAAALQRACGLTPKQAGAVFEAMDGADAMDAQRVVGFLSGLGRKTGR